MWAFFPSRLRKKPNPVERASESISEKMEAGCQVVYAELCSPKSMARLGLSLRFVMPCSKNSPHSRVRQWFVSPLRKFLGEPEKRHSSKFTTSSAHRAKASGVERPSAPRLITAPIQPSFSPRFGAMLLATFGAISRKERSGCLRYLFFSSA